MTTALQGTHPIPRTQIIRRTRRIRFLLRTRPESSENGRRRKCRSKMAATRRVGGNPDGGRSERADLRIGLIRLSLVASVSDSRNALGVRDLVFRSSVDQVDEPLLISRNAIRIGQLRPTCGKLHSHERTTAVKPPHRL